MDSDEGSRASDSTEVPGCHLLGDPLHFVDQRIDAQDKVVFNVGDALIVMPDTVYAKYKNELEFTVEDTCHNLSNLQNRYRSQGSSLIALPHEESLGDQIVIHLPIPHTCLGHTE